MNTDHDLDRLLTAWLSADAPMREPESLLGTVLARTARTKRRPAWRIPERWIPMSAISTRFASSTRVPVRTVGAVALLILALAVGVAVLIGSQRRSVPAPFGPASNGALVFARDGDVVTADTPTSTARTIIGGPDRDGVPWFAGDGSRFLFVKGDPSATAELWAADADGTHALRLAQINQIAWVDWSPQKDVIALLNDADPTVITLVRADGSGSTEIRPGLATIDTVSWRPPDGGQLLFRGKDAAGDQGIYIVDRSGANLRHLDLDPGFVSQPGYADSQDYYFQDPGWSPDGGSFVYATVSPGDPGLRLRLADVDRAGTLGSVRTIGDPARASQFAPSFLPTGDGVVFQEVDRGNVKLMTVSLAPGALPRDLHAGSGEGLSSMAVSPDGTKVVVSTAPNDEVWMADLATGTSTDLGYVVHDVITWQRLAR